MEVPVSYRDPSGQSLELALGLLPAADPAKKIGTLIWNPGGPLRRHGAADADHAGVCAGP
jgi:hypothetical protein